MAAGAAIPAVIPGGIPEPGNGAAAGEYRRLLGRLWPTLLSPFSLIYSFIQPPEQTALPGHPPAHPGLRTSPTHLRDHLHPRSVPTAPCDKAQEPPWCPQMPVPCLPGSPRPAGWHTESGGGGSAGTLPVVINALLTHAGGCLRLQGSPGAAAPGAAAAGRWEADGEHPRDACWGLAAVEEWVWTSGIPTPAALHHPHSGMVWLQCPRRGRTLQGCHICVSAEGSSLSLGSKNCPGTGGKDFWKPPVKRAGSESTSPSFHPSANIPHPTADHHRQDSPKWCQRDLWRGFLSLLSSVPRACESMLGSPALPEEQGWL